MVATLTESKLSITRELNNTKGPAVSEDTVQAEKREKEEKKRMKMYLQLQAREISALKTEITMLKRKDVPPLPTLVSQIAQIGTNLNNLRVSNNYSDNDQYGVNSPDDYGAESPPLKLPPIPNAMPRSP